VGNQIIKDISGLASSAGEDVKIMDYIADNLNSLCCFAIIEKVISSSKQSNSSFSPKK
jgi:hypothetical protein